MIAAILRLIRLTKTLTVQIPVAEGAHDTFAGIKKDWVPDFVHGDDGFGNMNFPEVQVRQTPTLDV